MPEAIGNVYNITRNENVSLREVIEFICHMLNLRLPEFVPIHQSHTIPKRVLNSIETFIPYFEESHHFDLSETLKLLGCESFEHDDFKAGIMRMIKYCWDNKLLVNKKPQKEFCY
jgi:nucleoside-diphosphate-sugar epimerase